MGDPVAHSLSPRMQNAAITALGLDAVYVALKTCPDTLELVVRGVLAAGGALNVTVPHKRAVVSLLDEASPEVRRTGACNTVWGGLRGITGENTDVPAIREEAARLLDGKPVRRALVVGTGGSARAAAVAIADGWPEAVVEVLSRDARRADAFAAWAAGAAVRVEPAGAAERTQAAGGAVRAEPAGEGAVDLVVNATPLGLTHADPLPLDLPRLRSRQPAAVLDLVYAKGRTRLVRSAREAGIAAEDGRGVLVAQGALAFRAFFDLAAPLEVMRAAVEDALRA